MRGLLATALFLALFSGCAPSQSWVGPPVLPVAVFHDNPMLLPIADADCAWETVVDVIDDYFKIKSEEPVRVVGDILTEGRLETYPKIAATILEPWHTDSVGRQARIESTLQSIRRRAVVRVMPAQGGYWVAVAVFKQLEDVRRPEHATAGAATLRYDASLTRVVDPVGEQQINAGWIDEGRDTALEQRILGQLLARSGQLVIPVPAPLQDITTSYVPAAAQGVCWAQPSCGFCGLLDCCPCGLNCAVYGELYAAEFTEFALDTCLDYQRFYTCQYMWPLGIGIGTAAVLANTAIDENFQEWHDREVLGQGSSRLAKEMKKFGEGGLMLPIFAGATLLGPLLRPAPGGDLVGDWGSRCLRSMAVGGPPLLALQWTLGASRPCETPSTSQWDPLDDNNAVSGHAFVGATAFINAAKMADSMGLKATFYTLSVLPAWSRINDRRHYLSQAALGWWLAYLAASAVDETERFKRDFVVMPLATNGGLGMTLAYRW